MGSQQFRCRNRRVSPLDRPQTKNRHRAIVGVTLKITGSSQRASCRSRAISQQQRARDAKVLGLNNVTRALPQSLIPNAPAVLKTLRGVDLLRFVNSLHVVIRYPDDPRANAIFLAFPGILPLKEGFPA